MSDILTTIKTLFSKPLLNLIEQAHAIEKPKSIQKSALYSIKTGNCPEDCAYCPQSGHYKTGVKAEKLCSVELVEKQAIKAKDQGASRFCLGAAWRSPPKKDFPKVLEMIKVIKKHGLEACVTLGTIDLEQAKMLKEAGLDYYNHNLDSSREFYQKIITTREYNERLTTLENVSNAAINVCCGGIIGMGESREDRVNFIYELAKLPSPPQSIPINMLIPSKGTPLEFTQPLDELEFVRVLAVARIMFPNSTLRLSAGREDMSAALQTLCFYVGAGSIFIGDLLLTAKNQSIPADEVLLTELYGN